MTPTPLRRILCPVDGSDASAQASRQAITFARWFRARITALHVMTSAAAIPLEMLPPQMLDQGRKDAEAETRRWMESQFREATDAGLDVDFLVQPGTATRAILEQAVQLGADLIVMGTHGAGGFEHLMLGSVTEKVLRRAACPVLTVPPHVVAVARPFANILCAIDFSDCSLAALEFAMTTALSSGAGLTLAHVLEWPWPEPPAPNFSELPAHEAAALSSFRRARELSARQRLETLIPVGASQHCGTRTVHGRPHVEIIRLAAEMQADLIVLGVHGRRSLDMALFGSTTNQVVRHATCPVLSVRR